MDLAADLDIFLTDFGTDAVVGGETVRCLFDDGYSTAAGGFVGGNSPSMVVKSSVTVSIGDSVELSGKTYEVATVEPDSTGLTLLRLEEQ